MRGRKQPPAVRRRISLGLQKRKEQGLPVGQPRKNPILDFVCLNCGAEFKDTKGNKNRTACSPACAVALAQKANQKLPDDNKVVELYLSGLTQTEIGQRYGVRHNAVGWVLKRAGCPIRKTHTRPRCKEQGCKRPVYRTWHPKMQVWYGTQCKEHRDEWRRKLNREYQRKRRAQVNAAIG
jgi:hypothetical protein